MSTTFFRFKRTTTVTTITGAILSAVVLSFCSCHQGNGSKADIDPLSKILYPPSHFEKQDKDKKRNSEKTEDVGIARTTHSPALQSQPAASYPSLYARTPMPYTPAPHAQTAPALPQQQFPNGSQAPMMAAARPNMPQYNNIMPSNVASTAAPVAYQTPQQADPFTNPALHAFQQSAPLIPSHTMPGQSMPMQQNISMPMVASTAPATVPAPPVAQTMMTTAPPAQQPALQWTPSWPNTPVPQVAPQTNMQPTPQAFQGMPPQNQPAQQQYPAPVASPPATQPANDPIRGTIFTGPKMVQAAENSIIRPVSYQFEADEETTPVNDTTVKKKYLLPTL